MNKVRWLGHAAFQITTGKGRQIYIDPWLEGNPACPVKKEDLPAADLVLVTHDHFDHMGDAAALLQAGGGKSVGQPELIRQLERSGVAGDKLTGMNVGGSVEIDGITVTMTHAFHSAGNGAPVGFILTLEDGKVIYHSGDTGLFGDLELFGRLYHIDLALLPIGSVFTMDPKQAAVAVKLLAPKAVIPMHYGSFPILVQSAAEFNQLVAKEAPGVEAVALEPGGEWEF
ncbi:MAG: metal-dependent hydrolase [bacterium]|jgi:L-ascorbate metabolism protein UlaG (beta-lactamase superfamily)